MLNLKLLSYSDLTVKEQENIITDFLNYAITYASWEAPSGLKTFIEQIQILIKEITQIFKINIIHISCLIYQSFKFQSLMVFISHLHQCFRIDIIWC